MSDAMPAAVAPRLAVRAVILEANRLLLVNALPRDMSDLWCAPGGGVDAQASLIDNLVREVHEETGLDIAPGAPCLVNEFHAPERGFHQVEIFFRARITGGRLEPSWRDPEGVVTERVFFTADEVADLRVKPDALAEIAWSGAQAGYDPLERLAR